MSRRIVCITPMFPSRAFYWRGTFVANFCQALRRRGCHVDVICAVNYFRMPFERFWDFFAAPREDADSFNVERPGLLSFARLARRNHTISRMIFRAQRRALERSLDRLKTKPDLVYAHFIRNGLAAARWCQENGVQLVVVSGESSYEGVLDEFPRGELSAALNSFAPLFFVSEKNQKALTEFFGENARRGKLLPNAVDGHRFYPISQSEARQKLGLPEKAKIVVFVGYFIERKGIQLLSKAISELDGVTGIFLGIGPLRPFGSHVLYSGPVENAQLPLWLNAGDCFVLPSLQEGRSNAVLEAMACGLPIVVSDRPFNREFLDERSAEFVDPLNVSSIREGIKGALCPGRAAKLRAGALEISRLYSLDMRAEVFLKTALEDNAWMSVDATGREPL